MRVIFTAASERDLNGIADYIAQDNAQRAQSFAIELHTACLSLENNPERFSLIQRHQSSGIRRRVHGNYSIFYRISGQSIEIIRILNSAMDYEPMLL